MRAAFTTVMRPGNTSYIKGSVESMLEEDPLARDLDLMIFSDSVEAPPLPDGIRCVCRTPEELAAVQTEDLVNARNQIRLLRWVSDRPADELVLTFEDDVEFAHDWLQKALDCAKLIKEPEFVLLLSHFMGSMPEEEFDPLGISASGRGVWRAEKKVMFWGAQAVMMQAGLARKIADAMEQGIAAETTNLGKQCWGIADQGIVHYCQSITWTKDGYTYVGWGKCNMYGVHPCLVNHIGAVSSTGLPGGGIKTGCFQR